MTNVRPESFADVTVADAASTRKHHLASPPSAGSSQSALTGSLSGLSGSGRAEVK